MFLGPISGASGKGNGDGGPVVSVLFVLLGCSMLLGTRKEYHKHRADREIPPSFVLGIGGLAVLFVASGVWGLLR